MPRRRRGRRVLHTDGSASRRSTTTAASPCCCGTTPSSTSGSRATRAGARASDLLERPVSTGAESFLAGTASCRIEVEGIDELYEELRAADVLHPVSRDGVDDTDFGTREFATLDLDGNLVTFYLWVEDVS